MKEDLVLLDLFSGIGGFAAAFEDAGYNIKKHYFSEIEKHAIANYKYNFKNAEYVGSVTDIRGESLGKVDIITFGSPCQDFSIAGKRKGLAGERSSLIEEAIRLISEKKPRFFIWENVKGSFSSNDSEDFWEIIKAFTNIGNYRLEWQLLNTLWILPQNRERIYLIGHLATPGRSFNPVFPITKNDNLFRIQEKTTKGQSQTKHSSTLGKGTLRADETYINVPKHSGTFTAGANSGGLLSDMTTINVEKFTNHQQDRVYHTNGAMGCLSKNRTDDKVKIFSTQPRSGNPKKGGTGLLSKEDSTYCLDTNNSIAIEDKTGVRRLTEIECERLQGFKDNWTQFGIYEKQVWTNKKEKTFKFVKGIQEIPKTARYNLLGNAVTKQLVEKIALKLKPNFI